MRYSLDAPTLRALLEKGEHHASSMWFPYEFYAAIDKVDGLSAVQQEQLGTYVGKINTKRAPTDNIHLRNGGNRDKLRMLIGQILEKAKSL